MPPRIGPLHEIILYVSNMIAQVSFYRDTLGLEVSYPDNLGDGSEAFWVVFNTGQCSLALHGGGEKRIGDDAPKIQRASRRSRPRGSGHPWNGTPPIAPRSSSPVRGVV